MEEQAPLCACGCGKPVKRAKVTDRRRGVKKGQWLRYLRGHGIRKALQVKKETMEQQEEPYIMDNSEFNSMITALSRAIGVLRG